MSKDQNWSAWRVGAGLLGIVFVFSCLVVLVRAAITQPPIGAWSAAPSLSQPRTGSSAALLPTGQILITGGDSGSGPSLTADLVSPIDGSISAASQMLAAREDHVSVALQTGQALVAGGVTTGGGVTNEAEIYDPVANAWSSIPGGMVEARAGATATLLENGDVLIAGGYGNSGTASSTAEIFDPNYATDNHDPFTIVTDALSSPRENHAAALLSDGRVLIVGGSNGTAALASSDIYDPTTGTIAPGPSMSTTRENLTATTLLNGLVLVAGGSHGNKDLSSLELFDPSANSGVGGFSVPLDAGGNPVSLVAAREGQQAVLLPHNGAVLIFGGTSSGIALASAELFTTSVSSSGAWSYADTATGAMTTPRSDFAASPFSNGTGTSVNDGLLLAIGGKDASGNTLAGTELYGFTWVKTDQYEYSPGSTAKITGGGWQPGETVQMTLVESPNVDNDGPVRATADSNGNISAKLAIDSQDAGVTFYMTAVGQTSSRMAQTTFADILPGGGGGSGSGSCTPVLTAVKTDTLSGGTTSLSNGSASWTWNITLADNNNSTSCGGTGGNTTWNSGNVLFEDQLPSGLSYSGLTDSFPNFEVTCEINSNTLTCSETGIGLDTTFQWNAGTSYTVSFTATTTSNGTYANPPSGDICEVDPSGIGIGENTTGRTCSDTVAVGTAAATSLSLSINPTSVPQGSAGPVSLSATLTSGGNDVSGAMITFEVDGTSVGTETTDANGMATLSLNTSSYTAGSGTVQAFFTAATLSGTLYSGSSSGTSTLTVVAPPTIAKSFNPTSILPNGTSTLTLTITNPAANAVAESGVAVSDTFPTGLVIVATPILSNTCGGTPTGAAGSSSLSLTGGSIAASGSCSVSVSVTATTAGTYNNTTGDVSSTNGGTGTTSNTATLTILSPPSVSKAFGAATIPLNGTTSLTFSISNLNAGTSLTGVAFTDTLPAGLVVSSPNGESGSCGGGTITATAGSGSVSLTGATLAANGSCSFSVNVTGTAAGVQNNSVQVTSTNGGTGNTSNASVTVIAPPTISKSFNPTTIAPNGTSTLTLTITNPAANTVAESGVAVSDTFPTGLVIVATPILSNTCGGTPTGTAGSSSLSLTGGSIAASNSCSVSVGVTAANPGSYVNTTGDVSSTNGGTGTDATATLTVLSPPSISKAFGAATIPLNGSTSLSFSISNPNAGTSLTGVAFTDTLPAGLEVSSPNGESGSCGEGTITATAGSGSVSLTGATLAANGSCNFSVNVTGITAGVQNNSVQATSTNGGTGNTSNASVTVIAPPGISKAFGAATIPLGTSTSLTLTITNPNSTEQLTGVGFTDSLPSEIVVATSNGLSSTCNGTATATSGSGSVSLTGGSIAAGGSCMVSLNVTGASIGTANNVTGNVTSSNGGTGNTASASVKVTAIPTTTTVTSNTTSIPYSDGGLNLTATVTALNGAGGTPTGSVAFELVADDGLACTGMVSGPRTITLGTENLTFSGTTPTATASLTGIQIKDPCEWSKITTGDGYTVEAVFTSTNSNYVGDTSTNGAPTGYTNPTLTVQPELALTTLYTGNEAVFSTSNPAPATLSATVAQDTADGSLASFDQLNSVPPDGTTAGCSASNPMACRVFVEFSLSSGSGACGGTYYAPVYDSGTPGVGIATVSVPLPNSCSSTLIASVVQQPVAGNPSYLYWTPGTDASDSISVSSGTSTSATGGGWVPDPYSRNGKTNFGLNVGFNKKGTNLQGNSVMVFRSTYGAACAAGMTIFGTPNAGEPVDVQVRTSQLASMSLGKTSSKLTYYDEAQLSAKASINVTDAITGTLLCSAGAGSGPNFFVTGVDSQTVPPGAYAASVYLANGVLYKAITLTSLGGGQIVIHVP